MGLNSINPLFVDSTKPIGDKVVTNVELTNIILYDDETLYLEITDQFGTPQRFALQAIATKKSTKYKCEFWLKLECQIQYRFLIESDGKQIFNSVRRSSVSGLAISEKWEPYFVIQLQEVKKDNNSTRRPELLKEVKPHREMKSNLVKPLCEPQFVAQIKSLLDDLV